MANMVLCCDNYVKNQPVEDLMIEEVIPECKECDTAK
jgi:hypothetical protein